MLKYSFLYCIIFILASCQNNKKEYDCFSVKKGKFQYLNKKTHCWYVIERNDSVQIEINTCSGNSLIKKVKWIDDFRYELTDISGNKIDTLNDGRVIKYSRKANSQLINIKEVANDFYVFEIVISDGNLVTDTIWINKVGGFKSIGDIFPEK